MLSLLPLICNRNAENLGHNNSNWLLWLFQLMADKTEQMQKFFCVIMLSQCHSILPEVHVDIADSYWDSTQPHPGLSLEAWTDSTTMWRAKKHGTLNPFDVSYHSQQLFSFLTMNASRCGDDYQKEILTAQAQGPVLSYKNEEMALTWALQREELRADYSSCFFVLIFNLSWINRNYTLNWVGMTRKITFNCWCFSFCLQVFLSVHERWAQKAKKHDWANMKKIRKEK